VQRFGVGKGARNSGTAEGGSANEGGFDVSQEFDRRSFLARSAVTASGIAMAGGAAELLGADIAGATIDNGKGLNGISSAKPKRGGKLTIGLQAEEQGFNPTTGRFDYSGFMYARTVFDPLMVATASGAVVPYLAESFTHNSDYTVWTITLRPNLKFHDGTPCDGAALFQNVDAQYKSPLLSIALKPFVASYKQSGPLSLELTLSHPVVTFPYALSETQVCFLAAPSMLNAPNGGTNNPVGTGPFVFKEWIPNDHFTATANPHYWRPGLPYLSQVTFKPIPDEQARAQALQSGTIDIMHTTDPSNLKSFYKNKSYAYVSNAGKMVGAPNVNCQMLNTAAAPFNDIEARKIVAMGTSAAAYAKIMDQGVNAPVDGIYLPGSPYYSKTPYPKYNQAAAKKAASAYAKKHGKPLSFTLNVVAAPQNIRQGEYAQQVMKNIGVNVTIKEMQQNELINNALFGSYQSTAWSQFGGLSPDLNYVWFSTTTAHATGISINMARNMDPQVESALIAGEGATNSKARVAAFRKLNERLGADIPYIWLDRTTWGLVSKTKVQNWNNPTTPDGKKALGQNQGVWWLTQAWV